MNKIEKYLIEKSNNIEMKDGRYIGYHVFIVFNGYRMLGKPKIVTTSNATKELAEIGGLTPEEAKKEAISKLEEAIKEIKRLK